MHPSVSAPSGRWPCATPFCLASLGSRDTLGLGEQMSKSLRSWAAELGEYGKGGLLDLNLLFFVFPRRVIIV